MPAPLRRIGPALLLALLALPAASRADDAATRVDRYLGRIETLRATFHQEVLDATGALREEADGTLVLAKPGRFRWDYTRPGEQVLVSDGASVWLYDVELEQVTVRRVDEALTATPASLLSGRGRPSDTFGVSAGGTADGLEWVVLKPRLDDTDFREVLLGFSGGTVARMELVDRLGQRTRIFFTGVELNPVLAGNPFAFEIPAGVDVIGTAARP